MFSSTTIELSTTIPTANAIPARLITFSVRPKAFIAMNEPIMLIGMATAITSVLDALRRYNNSVTMAKKPPMIRLCITRPMAPSMYVVSS